uniref:Uncharacterized protein n=1 Tax=Rhizophora mucronata TaxID=61149 RepID=A0A2P2R473_RHIMU
MHTFVLGFLDAIIYSSTKDGRLFWWSLSFFSALLYVLK